MLTLTRLAHHLLSRRSVATRVVIPVSRTGHDRSVPEFHRWKANLRILDVNEIKSVPYVPFSHPFIERLIGSLRREYLDQVFFWNAADLERKLADFQIYFNHHRTHSSLGGDTPAEVAGGVPKLQTTLNNFRWQTHCRGLYQLPAAA